VVDQQRNHPQDGHHIHPYPSWRPAPSADPSALRVPARPVPGVTMAKTTGTKGKGPEWVWPQNEAHENGIVGIGPDGPEVKKMPLSLLNMDLMDLYPNG